MSSNAARSSACCCPSSPCNASPRPPTPWAYAPAPCAWWCPPASSCASPRRPRVLRGDARLLLENQYGPTETHQVTYHSLSGDPAHYPDLPPIGRPLDGVEVQVLDAALRPVPVGVTGELYFGGDCLARGYHRAPNSPPSASSNIPGAPAPGSTAPATSGASSATARSSGSAAPISRSAASASSRPRSSWRSCARPSASLRGAAVVARERQGNDAFLAAFLLGEPEAVDLAELKQALRSELPEHMVPAHFAWVDGFALTPAASATTPPCARCRWSTGRTSSTWPRATTTSAPWPDSSASCWIVPG